ncbi:hypothetical protein LTR37_003069 [Vermiconidia calcicola]|uniref:Uncharacterized protein n=1 Tax=Vermiconidia calcicola TaxID=1690605 RepID=A0ACC3NS65_9PEZI|nr:hypothetical protein LTR37_003069 [Vermiconidia calcicola]
MGSSHSKQTTNDNLKASKNGNRGKSSSPNQEKHNSADSKAPLTKHVADLDISRTLSLEPNTTFGEGDTSLRQFRTRSQDEDEIRQIHITSPEGIRITSPEGIQVDELEGHSNITRPPTPPRIRRLSELIDPLEIDVDTTIRSPSGNLLAPEQFLSHPDRPRSIRERQQEIRDKVRAASRLGVEAANGDDEKPPSSGNHMTKKKSERSCRKCWCFG